MIYCAHTGGRESRSLSLEYSLPSGWAQCTRRRKVGMQMCSTWFSAKTEPVLNCLKENLHRHELLQERKRIHGCLWDSLCRMHHYSSNPWELCFECIELSVCGLLESWSWHLGLVVPFDTYLCVLVFPIQRVHTGKKFPSVSQVRHPDLMWLLS